MGLILWIIFGALAGWIASVIMKTDSNQGTIMDIIMGVIGAIVGGFNLYSLIVAVIGAVVVIYIGRMMRNG